MSVSAVRVSAVILECNPFHEGHRYILERAAAESDYTIAVMSGDFAQRGIPCIYSMETRARDVLSSAADLCIELPVPAATASADLFAQGGISLIQALGCVTDLYFGSESGDTEGLSRAAEALSSESPAFQERLRALLSSGLSFPLARQQALLETAGIALPSSPNDLLGVSYLRHLGLLHSGITPHAVERISAPGASDLRRRTETGAFPGTHPEEVPVFADDFSSYLLARLLSVDDYAAFSDITPDLALRIRHSLGRYRSFTGFVRLLKTKDVTWTRLSRCLLHLLLGIRKEDAQRFYSMGAAGYARVIGFRREAAPLLSVLKERSRTPLITRASQGKQLPAAWRPFFAQDLFASEVWDHIHAMKAGEDMTDISAYRKKIIVL